MKDDFKVEENIWSATIHTLAVATAAAGICALSLGLGMALTAYVYEQNAITHKVAKYDSNGNFIYITKE